MPRTATRVGAGLPPPTSDPLMTDELDIADGLSYPEMLRRAGAYRVPGKGIMHKLPFGRPYRRGGQWFQDTKAFPVAMSAEEARALTRATGERHDYYEPGAICRRCAEVAGDGVIAGWVLGGRKFQAEHKHVTDFDPTVYEAVAIDPPESADEDEVGDEAPALVEA